MNENLMNDEMAMDLLMRKVLAALENADGYFITQSDVEWCNSLDLEVKQFPLFERAIRRLERSSKIGIPYMTGNGGSIQLKLK